MDRKLGTRPGILNPTLAFASLVWLVACTDPGNDPETESTNIRIENEFVGSSTCKECHARFYELWEPSHHGQAMQVFTPEFACRRVTPQEEFIRVEDREYRAVIRDGQGWILERGPDGEKRYPIEHALGGKNLFYFLTTLEKGRLQVLPLAYDVRRKGWYDATGSMVRHFIENPDEALNWRDRPLTFNTSCHGCHVSQMQSNYDLESDAYSTTWLEPGINCETCHGPAGEHIRRARAAGDQPLPDPGLIVTREFTARQTNDSCAPCHAKMFPLTDSFTPGDRYFDHFGLHALENRDFYPDGRDLGENYTFTLWRLSPCTKSGEFDCLHCHTSSGRNRHTGEKADQACLPCHDEIVKNPAEHTFHPVGSEGSRCISCHMPKTEFARMVRHDHSMLPPTPATSIEFGSPNACNICHSDRDAEWANRWVTKWYGPEYQKPFQRRARLIDDARREKWGRLEEILAYISDPAENEIFKVSLVRLLSACPDERKIPGLIRAAADPSPLVRSGAVTALGYQLNPESVKVLLNAIDDDYRLVRVMAAASLAGMPSRALPAPDQARLRRGIREYEASLKIRPDDWSMHYNLGNLYHRLGRAEAALKAYETAVQLAPDVIAPRINASMLEVRRGNYSKAEQHLRKALEAEPDNPEANFNMGLLTAELGRRSEAEKYLRRALKGSPDFAEAAFNLGILLAESKPHEGLKWSRKAAELRPEQPRYAYTLAFYLDRSDLKTEAVTTLNELISRYPEYSDAYALLGSIYERQGQIEKAQAIYRRAASIRTLPAAERKNFQAKAQ